MPYQYQSPVPHLQIAKKSERTVAKWSYGTLKRTLLVGLSTTGGFDDLLGGYFTSNGTRLSVLSDRLLSKATQVDWTSACPSLWQRYYSHSFQGYFISSEGAKGGRQTYRTRPHPQKAVRERRAVPEQRPGMAVNFTRAYNMDDDATYLVHSFEHDARVDQWIVAITLATSMTWRMSSQCLD